MIVMFKKIFSYFSEYKKSVILYIFLCLAGSTVSLMSPYVTGSFIDSLIINGGYQSLYRYCVVFFLLFIFSTTINYACRKLYVYLQMQMGFQFNMDIIEHVQRVDAIEMGKLDAAYLSQQINNDTNELIIFGLTFLQNVITHSATFIIPVILLSRINSSLTLVMFFATVFYAMCYLLTKNIMHENNKIFKEAQSTFFSRLNEQLKYITFIKLHSVYSWFKYRLKNAFNLLFQAGLKQQTFSLRFSSLNNFVLTLMQISLFLVAGKAIIDGELSIGQFTIFSTFFSMMISSIKYFIGLGKTIQESLVSYSRIEKILKMPVAATGKNTLDHVTKLVIKDLTFGYGNNLLFSNFSYAFEVGKLYILCGSNGSGKSTLINLLSGMFTGEVLTNISVDGCSLQSLNLEYYRQELLAVSEQESLLVADTFLDNISFGNPDKVDFERLNELITLFKLNNLFNKNCDVFNFIINDKNSNLSGGEKQKISVIRTLLKDTDIMIFDEPTSAMDAESKQTFCKIIEHLKAHKIIIVVSHDRNFIDLGDEIIDIDKLKS